MKQTKYIVDTTLRDGEQSPGIALRAEDKLKIAQLLDEIGVYEIEAGIPVLSEVEEESIKNIINHCHKSKISVWSRMDVHDVRKSVACKPDIIHIGAPVSYVQIYSKLKKNKSWVMKNIMECIEVAKSHNVEVTVGLEDASRSDIGFILSMIKELQRLGVTTIRVADTVGTLTPFRTKELIETIKMNTDLKIEMHVHNDLGMAIANSIIGAKAGADYIDCTLFGIGERTGNCNFYDFIHACESVFQFSMNKKQVRYVEQMVCKELENAI
ncbi:MAG: Homocitrate synthase [Herbinix sp.]|jgi:homocitrate synthase NifV|nr:Homocitrate synthase [Herbinix sp.]